MLIFNLLSVRKKSKKFLKRYEGGAVRGMGGGVVKKENQNDIG